MKRIIVNLVTPVIVLILVAMCCADASAKQFKQHVHGRDVVVHTNPIPVVLHRMVPPQHGRHVTQREVEAGKLPEPQSKGTGLLARLR
jgi:hypothetical protein